MGASVPEHAPLNRVTVETSPTSVETAHVWSNSPSIQAAPNLADQSVVESRSTVSRHEQNAAETRRARVGPTPTPVETAHCRNFKIFHSRRSLYLAFFLFWRVREVRLASHTEALSPCGCCSSRLLWLQVQGLVASIGLTAQTLLASVALRAAIQSSGPLSCNKYLALRWVGCFSSYISHVVGRLRSNLAQARRSWT